MEKMSRDSRSRIMRGVKSKNTTPEMIVRKFLHAAGLRYRLHVPELPGTPDLVFVKHRAVVEVRGCFWHGHFCLGERQPRTNAEFWIEKLARNKRRDAANLRALRRLGYRVKVVWECELQPKRLQSTLGRLMVWIQGEGR